MTAFEQVAVDLVIAIREASAWRAKLIVHEHEFSNGWVESRTFSGPHTDEPDCEDCAHNRPVRQEIVAAMKRKRNAMRRLVRAVKTGQP